MAGTSLYDAQKAKTKYLKEIAVQWISIKS